VSSLSNENVLEGRLEQATRAELDRLCELLAIDKGSGIDIVRKAYLGAADNTIASITRPLIPSKEPSYSQILRLIHKELRSFSEGLDETWKAVKSLKFWKHQSAIDQIDDWELEERIFKLYAAEYSDAKKKLVEDPSLWSKVTSYLPGVSSATAGAVTVATATAATATRLPLAGVTPGLVAGPAGIAMAVVLLGVQASGPAYRKIVPATVELMLIGRRIKYMPKD
jgi:hypothetical protein